jgi:hypothetical protein
LREYWESKLGISLPEDAEVWSKPRHEDEIYGFDEGIVVQPAAAA